MKARTSVLPLTCRGGHSIIHGVSALSTTHRNTSGLMIAVLAGALFLPPTHVHLAADADEHHHAPVEHAHWAAHHQSRLAFDDDDGRVLFIDRPALIRLAYTHGAPPHIAVVALLALTSPLGFSGIAARAGGNAVRDGPTASAPSLRGPPFVL